MLTARLQRWIPAMALLGVLERVEGKQADHYSADVEAGAST